MKFYHGTRNGDLKELNLEHYSGKIYLTDSYGMALLYAASPFRLWRYDKEKDKVVFRELRHDTFKILYKGKKCYIFECECDDYVKDESNQSNHTYISTKPIKLGKREVIEDAYQKMLELEKKGEIILERWEDYSPEIQRQYRERFFSVYTEEVMRKEKNFPESYQAIISLFPELEVKD